MLNKAGHRFSQKTAGCRRDPRMKLKASQASAASTEKVVELGSVQCCECLLGEKLKAKFTVPLYDTLNLLFSAVITAVRAAADEKLQLLQQWHSSSFEEDTHDCTFRGLMGKSSTPAATLSCICRFCTRLGLLIFTSQLASACCSSPRPLSY